MQENHDWERKRKRALNTSLLKKPDEEKETMAELAAEAAAAAAGRKEHIREVGRGRREGGSVRETVREGRREKEASI